VCFLAGEINSIEFNFDPRFVVNPIRTTKPTVNLIRQQSYLSAVRPNHHSNEQTDFGRIIFPNLSFFLIFLFDNCV